MLRVRFAPSPTGYLHIGGARTCLFNWLYARKNQGEFILRIEDTDRERSKKEYLDEILESIKWLKMDWDEIFYQSQRFNLYREHAQKLIKDAKAYEKEGAVFFKYQFEKIEINDLIRGKIIFEELPKEEEVIIKSDGSPTYNFSCVVDDALMKISHVIRGEDHISNTPKQILMYQALGFKLPQFAHLPLILAESGGRMSKRFGATSIREYKEMGYLPEAIINYFLLLGWSPGKNQEIISLEEAKDIFDIKDINKTGAAFSLDKLNWLSSAYIKKKDLKELSTLVKDYLKSEESLSWDEKYLEKVVALFKERISKLKDLIDWAGAFLYDDFSYQDDCLEILEKKLVSEFKTLIEDLNSLASFDRESIEKKFRETVSKLDLKAKDLVHPTRVALTGKRVGPGLFETMQVLGKNKVIERLKKLINYWGGKNL